VLGAANNQEMIPMNTQRGATVADLYATPDKAELVDRRLLYIGPTGAIPGYAGDQITHELLDYAEQTGRGMAVGDNKAFLVDLPHRQSFSPCAALFMGPPAGMKFFDGAPIFAAEVRSEGDYGPAAERAIATKRRDYFTAGTLVVWDVDLQSPDVVRVYRADTPDTPTIYRRGEQAEAEPAVPGWTMPVDGLFRRGT